MSRVLQRRMLSRVRSGWNKQAATLRTNLVIADPFGYLAEDEVHFRSSKELGDPLVDSNPFLVTGDVLVHTGFLLLE